VLRNTNLINLESHKQVRDIGIKGWIVERLFSGAISAERSVYMYLWKIK